MVIAVRSRPRRSPESLGVPLRTLHRDIQSLRAQGAETAGRGRGWLSASPRLHAAAAPVHARGDRRAGARRALGVAQRRFRACFGGRAREDRLDWRQSAVKGDRWMSELRPGGRAERKVTFERQGHRKRPQPFWSRRESRARSARRRDGRPLPGLAARAARRVATERGARGLTCDMLTEADTGMGYGLRPGGRSGRELEGAR